MKNRIKAGLAGTLTLLGVGCTMLPIQNTLKATDLSKGSIEIAVNGATRSTQSRLNDIDHVLFTLQSVKAADATKSLTLAQLTQGGASGSVIFPNLWPGTATVSATVYGSNEIRTQTLLGAIGTATATASVVGGQVTSVPLSIKLDTTQTQSGGLAINLGLQAGDEEKILLPYKVTTIAGSTQGTSDGQGTAAQFYAPNGIAVDANGTLYVADTNNKMIRKITPLGLVSTLTGNPAAQFSSLGGIAVDATGTLYVTDSSKIRKITPGGSVSTLAGSTSYGSAVDAQGTAAVFYSPLGIAVDANGSVYVADTNNNKIRKITPGGWVSTLAGSTSGTSDGQGTEAQFYRPQGIAVDAAGNVYVADVGNRMIRKITPQGWVSTLAGSTFGINDGQGTEAQFSNLTHLALDPVGNIYVKDSNRIRKITPGGWVRTIAGNGSIGSNNGTGTAASFYNPIGIAVDAAGNLYVADTYNHLIRKVSY